VWSFDVDDDDAFIAEVIRLLALLPDRGLILDLRANPGGVIWAAERMLQLFTSSTIVPTRFGLVASPLTRAMARSPFNRLELEAWAPSLEVTLATGDAYSQPLPLTDPAWCNDVGRHYRGPVVCVVDANTYSSGDLFAAGFVDNALGTLVSVGEATGAGGANVWTDVDLREALADTPFALEALPDGVRYTVAIRRAVRSGASDGLPIEDLGVPGVPYAMTRDDLLRDNRDLIAFCARQLERGG
jgi:C-terminal processing protease CtpA/Prc